MFIAGAQFKCHNLAQLCRRIADLVILNWVSLKPTTSLVHFEFSDFKQTHFDIGYPVKDTLQWQDGGNDRTLQVLQTLPKYVYVEI